MWDFTYNNPIYLKLIKSQKTYFKIFLSILWFSEFFFLILHLITVFSCTDVGVGPDIPIPAPDKTPCLGRKVLAELPLNETETTLRRQPSLTHAARPSSPLYENLPKKASQGRWAYESLRASHKFSWNSTKNRPGETSNTADETMSSSLNTSSSRCTSLNNSLDGDSYQGSPVKPKNPKPAALDFWQRQEHENPKRSMSEDSDQEPSPFR